MDTPPDNPNGEDARDTDPGHDQPPRQADAPRREPIIDPDAVDETIDRVAASATRFGSVLNRLARRAVELGGEAARDARPEAERLAKHARSAADAARPRVERAGREAIRYVREHDQEIKRAAIVAGEITARQAMPTRLRPIVNAIEADRWRRAPLRDNRAAGAAAPPDDTSTDTHEAPPTSHA